MKKFLHKNIIIVILLGFLIPRYSFAIQFYFDTDSVLYGRQDTVQIDVLLDTEGKTVNTISGSIKMDGLYKNDITIIDGNSSVLFWIERPSFVESEKKVQFSGITPGGLVGDKLFLFSIKIPGEYIDNHITLGVEDAEILLHDGLGTLEIASFIAKNIYISDDLNFSQRSHQPVDKEAPEDFTPMIVQDENLYDGKVVLVFATQDKGSGIDRFEIKEGYLGKFIEGESPYLLKDQKSFKTLFVKAVDNEGNERIAIVHPQKKIFDENFILIFSILIVLGIIVSVVYRRKRRS